jgi:hypothetical protein
MPRVPQKVSNARQLANHRANHPPQRSPTPVDIDPDSLNTDQSSYSKALREVSRDRYFGMISDRIATVQQPLDFSPASDGSVGLPQGISARIAIQETIDIIDVDAGEDSGLEQADVRRLKGQDGGEREDGGYVSSDGEDIMGEETRPGLA